MFSSKSTCVVNWGQILKKLNKLSVASMGKTVGIPGNTPFVSNLEGHLFWWKKERMKSPGSPFVGDRRSSRKNCFFWKTDWDKSCLTTKYMASPVTSLQCIVDKARQVAFFVVVGFRSQHPS